MCKNPTSECKPIEEGNPPAEEDQDNVISEDDSDSVDSDDDYYTESSVDNRTDSESDAESASGNRVTPEMVLLLMLKEQGAITEEQYEEKAEKCKNNFRSLIPTIPRSSSVDSIDYTRDLSEEESDDEKSENESKNNAEFKEKLLLELIGDDKGPVIVNELVNRTTSEKGTVSIAGLSKEAINLLENDKNKSHDCKDVETTKMGNVESHETTDTVVFADKLKDLQCIQGAGNAKDNNARDLAENHTDKSQDGKQCNGEVVLQKQKANTHTNINKSHEDVLRNSQHEVLLEPNEEIQQKTVNTLMSVNKIDEDLNKNCGDRLSETISKETATLEFEITGAILPEVNDKNLGEIEDNSVAEKIALNNFNENNIGLTEDRKNNDKNEDTKKQDIALAYTGEESKTKTAKSLNEIDPVTGKITKSFRYILNKLIREKRITEEAEKDRINDEYGEPYGETLRSFVRGLDDHYKNNMTGSKMNVSNDSDDEDDDDGDLKEFALYLNFYSPSSYKYILETFNTPLPEHKVLCSWYLKNDHEPGLTEAAFKILKQKSSVKRLTCSLMMIDIFLKNEGRYYDSVDYGAGPHDICMDKAVLAYVFVLVSLDEDWKMPIGYIYARNVPAETQAELVRVCLTLCHEAGADVVAVTLETLTPAEFLGCSFQDPKNLKTTFKHPVCDRDVAIWIDPCLALKSARQTLKVKGSLIDDKGDKIRWNLIRKLRRIQSDDSTYLEKPEFFELQNHIAKSGLTSETFSRSLATALDLCEDLLPYMFLDTEPTRKYILIINMIYDILNSKTTTRMRHVAAQLYLARVYLLSIFCNEENGLTPLDRENLAWDSERRGYRFFLKGEAACGFMGFLICIESFKHLYTTLVKKERRLTCLNPQRLCKVQAENFVTTLRAHVGWKPEYFKGEAFQQYYRKLFDIIEKNPMFSDKSVPLERWPLHNRYPPAVTIKLTSGKRSYDDIYSSQYKLKKLKKDSDDDRATKLVREYSKALDTEMDLSTRKNMVGYLAGWIAAKFAKCLRCEGCIDSLCTDKKLWFHKFITMKRIYGVCLPSEEVFRICWECERALRLKGSAAKLRAWVLRRLAPRLPWNPRGTWHPPGHGVQLARAVLAKYIPLRIPAPFSFKDRKLIIDMYRRFTSKDRSDSFDELADWLNASSEEDDDQLY